MGLSTAVLGGPYQWVYSIAGRPGLVTQQWEACGP